MFQISPKRQVNQPGRGRCHIALLGGHRCYPPSGSDHPARLSDQKAPGAKFHDHLQEGLHPGGHVFRGSTLVDEFLGNWDELSTQFIGSQSPGGKRVVLCFS